MKLLFDENVSHRPRRIACGRLPGEQPRQNGRYTWDGRSARLGVRPKRRVRNRVEGHRLRERGYVDGAPPKIVWLDVGNAGTKAIEELLRREYERVNRFAESEESSVLILSLDQNAV